MSNIMRRVLFFILLAIATRAEHRHAWETGTEYQYLVRGRTLAALQDVSDMYTGIVMKSTLKILPTTEDTLQATLSSSQYAEVHTKLPQGWRWEIPDHMLDYKQLPVMENVFQVSMKHGTIRDVAVDKDVPTWQVNLIKSVISQFQIDTQGEYLMPSRYNQEPRESDYVGTYKTMEDTVGGKCQVLYDISSLSKYEAEQYKMNKNEYESQPRGYAEETTMNNGEQTINIMKTKNYTNCEQRMSYVFGITGSSSWEPTATDSSQFMSRSTISRIIITGDLKKYTVHSALTTDMVVLSPDFFQKEKGMVGSMVNVTLVKMGKPLGRWEVSNNLQSTGNLVYNYNNPFATRGNDRRTHTTDPNSNERFSAFDANSREDESSASLDSKSTDSMEKVEDLRHHWQPTPTMNDAPQMPFFPYFTGYYGKSVQSRDNYDITSEVKRLATYIGQDLQNPNTLGEEQTLEKFMTMTKLLRAMDVQQITEVRNVLYCTQNEMNLEDDNQNVQRSTWVAFRDALAQTGTGPALLVIKKMIEDKKMMGLEAAGVVDVLSKTVRTPTPEYMETFYSMVTMPVTMSQQFLNTSALMSFAELIRYSQVNHDSAHTYYPVHTFGRLSPKHNPNVYNKYIPYMAEQMKRSIESKEGAKSLAYIWALGSVAHPKILEVYEPYLEGKVPASTYQRLLMVMSMNNLATLRPRLARGIFYRIYQNTEEAHQLRCAAVVSLIWTNPPESMLQRIAEYTHYDTSMYVNAAVKSAIDAIVQLEDPKYRKLVAKAKNVLPLVADIDYGFEYSKNYIIDYVLNEMNVGAIINYAHVGSDESYIPQVVRMIVDRTYGDYKAPPTEIGAMISSFKDLYNIYEQQYPYKDSRYNSADHDYTPEKISRLLNLRIKRNDFPEGAFWMNNLYYNAFMSYDWNTLQQIPQWWKTAYNYLKSGYDFNTAKILDYDMTLSFPMESGMPFLYTLNIPTLYKASGTLRGNIDSDNWEGKARVHLIHACHLHARYGFLTPFQSQYYSAGVSQDHQLNLPIDTTVKYDWKKKQISMKLEPMDKNEKYMVLEYSTTPYTSRQSIFSMKPVMKEKETQFLNTSEIYPMKVDYGYKTRGCNMEVKTESTYDSIANPGEEYWKYDPMGLLTIGRVDKKIDYYKYRVYLVPYKSSSQSVILTATYDTITTDSKSKTYQDEMMPKIPRMTSKTLNDPSRMKDLLNKVVEGITGAEGIVVDFGVDFPGQEPMHLMATMAYASSWVDKNTRGILLMSANGADPAEVCASWVSTSPLASVFDMEVAGKSPDASKTFNVAMSVGSTCEKGVKLDITGTQKQSEAYRKTILEMPIMTKCRNDVKNSCTSSPACWKVRNMLAAMTEAQMLVKFRPEDRKWKTKIEEVCSLLNNLQTAYSWPGKSIPVDEDTLEFSMALDVDRYVGYFSWASSNAMVYFNDVELGALTNLLANVNPEISTKDVLNYGLNGVTPLQDMCTIGKDEVKTFDQARYKISLDKHWYVVMVATARKSKNIWVKSYMHHSMKVTVLAKDAGTCKKVKIIVGGKEIYLKTVNDHVVVWQDGKDVDLRTNPIYRLTEGKNVEVEIYRRADESVRVYSSIYALDVIYKGKELWVKTSGGYRSDVRGLCGNYDGDTSNDMLTPNNCVTTKPDYFVPTWRIDSESGKPTYKPPMDDSVCEPMKIRPGNVISDWEAGRSHKSKKMWGYHSPDNWNNNSNYWDEHRRCTTVKTRIREEPDQICFSHRPLPTCSPTCKPEKTKPKRIPMYCMPKGPSAYKMAERVKQGANPDLSQKEVTTNHMYDLPVACVTA